MKAPTLEDFLVDGRFNYNDKLSPLENYQYFQQSISFSRGVEFISDNSVNGKPILYLYDLPGLSCDLKKAKQELKLFYDHLLSHVNKIINTENDAFVIYAYVYDLFKEVQEDLNHPAPVSFLGIERIMHNPKALADIRKKNIQLLRGTRKGAFIEQSQIGFKKINYKDLGSEIEDFIKSVFKAQERSKRKLFKELSTKVEQLFNKKRYLKHYKYLGPTADILEVAVLLYDQLGVYGKKNLTLEQFTKDLAGLLGMQFSKISDLGDVLINRKAKHELMVKKRLKVLTEYIDSVNK